MKKLWKILLIVGALLVMSFTIASATGPDCGEYTAYSTPVSGLDTFYDVNVDVEFLSGHQIHVTSKNGWSIVLIHVHDSFNYNDDFAPPEGTTDITTVMDVPYNFDSYYITLTKACPSTVELGISKDETCDGYEFVVNPPLSQIVGVIKYSRYAVEVDTLWSNYGFPQVYSSVWDGNEQVTLVVHLKFKTYGWTDDGYYNDYLGTATVGPFNIILEKPDNCFVTPEPITQIDYDADCEDIMAQDQEAVWEDGEGGEYGDWVNVDDPYQVHVWSDPYTLESWIAPDQSVIDEPAECLIPIPLDLYVVMDTLLM